MRMILKLSFLGLLLAATPAAAQSASEARDPKAIAALDAMGAFLRTQTNMKVIGEINTDDVIGKNQKIQYSGTVELMVRRPDGLRANVVSDRKNEQIFYDGKQFTVYEPKLGYYAAFAA